MAESNRKPCRVCESEIDGTGHIYCDGCKPPVMTGDYVNIYKPDHPRANKGGYVREHLVVMEQKIEKSLASKNVVHHIDGDTKNNHPDNLMLFKKSGDHTRHHALIRRKQTIEDLQKITSEEWKKAWLLDGYYERRDFFKSLGCSHRAARKGAAIAGSAYFNFFVQLMRWGYYATNEEIAQIAKKFETEYLAYVEAQIWKW